MKKILAMLLALSLVFAFVACGEEVSVEVNALKPADAFKKYVADVYTTNGFSMDAIVNYGETAETVKYSVLAPLDNSRMQYVYDGSISRAAFVSEIVNGAKLNFFYHTDAEGNKAATWIDAKKIATAAEIKPYVISKLLFTNGAMFDDGSVEMEFGGDLDFVFTATSASSSAVAAYKEIFPMPEGADRAAYEDEVKAIKYVYTVENGALKAVTIEGSVNGQPLSVKAENFAVLESGATLEMADADSYAKDLTAEEIAEIKKQQEAEAKAAEEAEKAAAEAATQEAAAGSGAETAAE